MATESDNKIPYNKFTDFPKLAANCINYLITNEQLIWRLLAYNDPDAYKLDSDHPNLTSAQKRALIYSGEPDQIPFRIFMDLGSDTARDDQVTMLRIAPVELIPVNKIYGYVSVGFEIFSHFRVNTLSNHQTRTDTICQRLIENFNGQEIGGLGKLHFDAMANSKSRSQLIGAVPFKGRGLIMCNWITS